MEDFLRIAWRNLSYHKARTALTLIGVIIGIAAVVALISLGNGLTAAVEEQLNSLGADKIIVSPKSGSSFGPPTGPSVALTQKDVDIVNKADGVDIAVPLLFKSLPVQYDGKTAQISFLGFPAGDADVFFNDVQRYKVAEGRQFKKGERGAIILGSKVGENFFDKEINVRDRVKILGKDITVIGIMESTGAQDDDTSVYMDIETLRDISNSKDQITFIFAKARDDPGIVAKNIEDDLYDYHDEELFVAYTTEQLIEQINSVFGILSFVLIGIAGISLVVAGFGILNTMLMSVIERTREIGIMKAIGATNHQILVMFLTESAIVGIIGGAVGTIVGYALSFAMSGLAVQIINTTLLIEVDPFLVAFVMGFAAFVGILSGTYPAYRAAKLPPVEALRYE